MTHLVLLGDSIFDNAVYTAGGSPVIRHVQQKLPAGWKASLLAVDGSLTSDIEAQFAKLPPDTTHLAVSVGGNNAILHSGFPMESAQSVADVFLRMATIISQFEESYVQMLDHILARSIPTMVCTIYYPNFTDALMQQLAVIGLMPFNDSILRAAIKAHIPVIDLRQVCAIPEDYANEIEPSVKGGEKIAAAIVRAVTTHDFSARQTTIYG